MFFDYRVNVQSTLSQMRNCISSEKIDQKSMKMIQSYALRIHRFVNKYKRRYWRRINPDKLKALGMIESSLEVMERAADFVSMGNAWRELNSAYYKYNLYAPSYLLRHPEKANEKQIGPESQDQRALTLGGVKQAKEFAEFLIDEVMMANIPVNLVIMYSPYKRTRLFAQIIKRRMDWAKAHYEKEIAIVYAQDSLISGDNKQGTDGDLEEWVRTTNASTCARLAHQWISQNHHQSGRYSIHVGVTHLPIVMAYVVLYLRQSAARAKDFRYADFIKMEGGLVCYEDRWL